MNWKRPFEPEPTGEGGGGGTMSDAEILAAVQRTDGAGSGYDADLVDGKQASELLPAAGPVSDTALGDRTADQTLVNPANTGPLSSVLSWLAGSVKGITGETDWKNVPATTLKTLKTRTDAHEGSRDGHPLATTTFDGLMVGADKAKLDGMSQSIISPLNGTVSIGGYPIGSTGFYYTSIQTGWPDYPGFVRTLKTASTEAFQILTDIYGESERARSWDSTAAAWRGWTVVNSGNFASVLHGHNAATAGGASGFQSGADKAKLDGLAKGEWITPTLTNGWINFGTPYGTAAFRKEPFGIVRLRGIVKNGTTGTASPIFTLPADYRPAAALMMPGENNGPYATVDIQPSGNISVYGGASNVRISFDAVVFPV